MKRVKVSNNVIRRLPRYLRKLDELTEAGVSRISSGELGRQLGLTPSQIRQDFSCFGEFGQQGYGYKVTELRAEIASSSVLVTSVRHFCATSHSRPGALTSRPHSTLSRSLSEPITRA